jgi:2-acylglycerol O-acyltransferase 2
MRSTLLVNLNVTPLNLVGRPIDVNKMDHATEEEVLRVQKLYCEELKRIWDEWKEVFALDRISELEIVQ